jgi:hypothetical protein
MDQQPLADSVQINLELPPGQFSIASQAFFIHPQFQVDYSVMLAALEGACRDLHIQPVQPFVEKVRGSWPVG